MNSSAKIFIPKTLTLQDMNNRIPIINGPSMIIFTHILIMLLSN